MQKRKYFFRRFRQYLLLFLLPVALVLLISLVISFIRVNKDLENSGRELVNSVNTDLDLSLNNISQQNVQFANNPYMLLSLKRILEKRNYLSYADSINLRSINASLKSTLTTYSYVRSVYLYLDHYDNYYSSGSGIAALTGGEEWYQYYQNMGEEETQLVVLPSDRNENGTAKYLTMLQRMPFFGGVVVMKVDVRKFQNLLSQAIQQNGSKVVFFNMQDEPLFDWGEGDVAVTPDKEEFPGAGERGKWEKVEGHWYLIHQSNNEDFRVQILSLLPRHYVAGQMMHYVPAALLMLAAGAAAALLTSYISTMRNFGYIEHIIQVLGEAERGNYSCKEEDPEADDEYGAILNNIIRLHLETERLNAELEQKKHLQEVTSLTALQAQINPHFMFNTLQMIQFQAAGGSKNQEDVIRMTSYLADILKYALADPLEPITLREEIGYLKKYVAIQHMRFGEQFIIYYEVEEELLATPVFRLMLQPIIENSILHGIRDKGEKGYIKLTVFSRNHTVHFRVFDTGVGMDPKGLSQLRDRINTFNVHNIGLANVNNRLKLYFGDAAGLKIHSIKGQGTIVTFELSLNQIEKVATKSKEEYLSGLNS